MSWSLSRKVFRVVCGPRGREGASDPEQVSAKRRAKWARLWSREAERPEEELSRIVPVELKEAVASGWIPKDVEVLDVGSGRGQISAWLAERGYAVLGAELSQIGTELARKHFGGRFPNLEFEVVDICRDKLTPNRFGAIVDRGCFHGLKGQLREDYVRNIAACAKPGAVFLLMTAVSTGKDEPDTETAHRRVDEATRAAFESYFIVERSAETRELMMRSVGEFPRTTKPGRAFWMRRRGDGG